MKQRQQSEIRPRKRWIVIGPGVVLALILSLQIVIANRQRPAAPPIVERQVVDSGVSRNVQPTPEIGYVLARRERLALSGGQVKTLGALQADWAARSKPLSGDLDTAAGEFNAFMEKAGNKATMSDIQSHAGSVSELSREMSSLRRVYWEKALQVLSKQQREAVEKELSHGYQPGSA